MRRSNSNPREREREREREEEEEEARQAKKGNGDGIRKEMQQDRHRREGGRGEEMHASNQCQKCEAGGRSSVRQGNKKWGKIHVSQSPNLVKTIKTLLSKLSLSHVSHVFTSSHF